MQNALNSGMFDPANRFEEDLGDDSEDEEEQMAAAYTYLQQLEYILPPC
jgi:lysyl-tRNA synthetase class II